MIDLYAASRRLDDQLAFKKVKGNAANQRGYHFEDQVQKWIDDTSWGRELPEVLKSLRERKRLKKADGSALTDVDAIGARADTVLIVSCKSMLGSNDLFLGTHSTARNRAEHLERSVQHGISDAEYLRRHPVGPNGSYDFSNYSNIVVVVCTPAPVYVELEMVRAAGLNVSELACTQEVLSGLPAAVTIVELAEWLDLPN